MKTKRILAATMAAVLAATALSGCSGGGESASSGEAGAKKVTIWAWDETFNIKALEEAKAIYAKENPDVEIDIQNVAKNDVFQRLMTGLSSGSTAGLPDVVLLDDYNVLKYISAFPDAFAPLDDIVDEEKFADYKFAFNKMDDKTYSVPFDTGVCGLFYRTDYLQEAGYTADDLNNITWEQYIEIGKTVKEKTGHAMLTLDPNDLGQISFMLQSAGSWYTEEDGETVNLANNQALKDAMTIYKNMLDAGIVQTTSDWNTFVSAFQSGDVASVPSGCWVASSVLQAADQSGKWAIAPIPRMGSNSKSVNASNFGGSGWLVLNNDNTETAKDFLSKTFASSLDLVNTLAPEINLISTMKDAKTTENYQKENEFFSNQKTFEDFSTWMDEVIPVNYGQHTSIVMDILTEAVQAITNNGTSIDDALAQAQTQAEAAVKS